MLCLLCGCAGGLPAQAVQDARTGVNKARTVANDVAPHIEWWAAFAALACANPLAMPPEMCLKAQAEFDELRRFHSAVQDGIEVADGVVRVAEGLQ